MKNILGCWKLSNEFFIRKPGKELEWNLKMEAKTFFPKNSFRVETIWPLRPCSLGFYTFNFWLNNILDKTILPFVLKGFLDDVAYIHETIFLIKFILKNQWRVKINFRKELLFTNFSLKWRVDNSYLIILTPNYPFLKLTFKI